MIDKDLLTGTVNDAIAGTDLFVVDIRISPDNVITVEVDSPTAVDIDECAAITRKIEEKFDRDTEDYELEVGSAGITSDFKIRAQYTKNIGNDVEVLTRDGRKLHGVLTAVAPGEPSDHSIGFTVEIPVKVKEPGAKKPVIRQEALQFTSDDCKYVRYDLKF
ncbi:MAG: ribosome assembly cofactor RimP [Muribaculaceae bacterium]|jgi:ribosome maturation factor RimP|nr:ribosome assembly cofactor RimP [Muribaculaceae bacterium]